MQYTDQSLYISANQYLSSETMTSPTSMMTGRS